MCDPDDFLTRDAPGSAAACVHSVAAVRARHQVNRLHVGNPLDSYNPRWNDIGHESAEVVVPMLVDWLSPVSAIDVGCGPGNWVLPLGAHGVKQVLGLDQNDYGADLGFRESSSW